MKRYYYNYLKLFAKLISDGILVVFLHAQLFLDDLELLVKHVLPVLLLHLLLYLHQQKRVTLISFSNLNEVRYIALVCCIEARGNIAQCCMRCRESKTFVSHQIIPLHNWGPISKSSNDKGIPIYYNKKMRILGTG